MKLPFFISCIYSNRDQPEIRICIMNGLSSVVRHSNSDTLFIINSPQQDDLPNCSDPVILEEEDNSKNRGTFQNGDRVRMDGVSHPSVVLETEKQSVQKLLPDNLLEFNENRRINYVAKEKLKTKLSLEKTDTSQSVSGTNEKESEVEILESKQSGLFSSCSTTSPIVTVGVELHVNSRV